MRSTNKESREQMSAEPPANKTPAPTAHGSGSGQPSFLQRFWLPTALVVAGVIVATTTGYEVVSVIQLLMDSQHGDQAIVGMSPR
jgi:hypothetical protein